MGAGCIGHGPLKEDKAELIYKEAAGRSELKKSSVKRFGTS